MKAIVRQLRRKIWKHHADHYIVIQDRTIFKLYTWLDYIDNILFKIEKIL